MLALLSVCCFVPQTAPGEIENAKKIKKCSKRNENKEGTKNWTSVLMLFGHNDAV